MSTPSPVSRIKAIPLAAFHASVPEQVQSTVQNTTQSSSSSSPSTKTINPFVGKDLDYSQVKRFNAVKFLWLNIESLPPQEPKSPDNKTVESKLNETDSQDSESSSNQSADSKSPRCVSIKSNFSKPRKLHFAFQAYEFWEFVAKELDLPAYLSPRYVISGSVARLIHQENTYIKRNEIQDLDLSLRFCPGYHITFKQAEIIQGNFQRAIASFIRSKFPPHWTWASSEEFYQFISQFCKFSGEATGQNRYFSVELGKINFSIIYDAVPSFFTADSILVDCFAGQLVSALPGHIVSLETVLQDAQNKKLRVADHVEKKDILFRFVQMGLLEGYTEFEKSVLQKMYERFLQGYFNQPKSFTKQVTRYCEKHFNLKTYGYFKASLFTLELYQLLITQHPQLWNEVPEVLFDLVFNSMDESCKKQELHLKIDWSLQLRDYFLLLSYIKEANAILPTTKTLTTTLKSESSNTTQAQVTSEKPESNATANEPIVRPNKVFLAALDFIYGCIYIQKFTQSEFQFDTYFLNIPLDETNVVHLRRHFPLHIIVLRWIRACETLSSQNSTNVSSSVKNILAQLLKKSPADIKTSQLELLKKALLWDGKHINLEVLATETTHHKSWIPVGFWTQVSIEILEESARLYPDQFLHDLPKLTHIASTLDIPANTIIKMALSSLKTSAERGKNQQQIIHTLLKEFTKLKTPLPNPYYQLVIELLNLTPNDETATKHTIELIRKNPNDPAKRKLVEHFVEKQLYPHHEKILDLLFAMPDIQQLLHLCYAIFTDSKKKQQFSQHSPCLDRIKFFLTEDKKTTEELKKRLAGCSDSSLITLCRAFSETPRRSLSDDLSTSFATFLVKVCLYVGKNPKEQQSLDLKNALAKWINCTQFTPALVQSLDQILKQFPKEPIDHISLIAKEVQKKITDENIAMFSSVICWFQTRELLEHLFPSVSDLEKKCHAILTKPPFGAHLSPMIMLLIRKIEALDLEQLTRLKTALPNVDKFTDKTLLEFKAALLKRIWVANTDDIARNEAICELLSMCTQNQLVDRTALTVPLFRQRNLTLTTRNAAWSARFEIFKSEEDKSVYYPFLQKIYVYLSQQKMITHKSMAEFSVKLYQQSSQAERILLYQFISEMNQQTWKSLILSRLGPEVIGNLLKMMQGRGERHYSSRIYRKVIGYCISMIDSEFPIQSYEKIFDAWISLAACKPAEMTDLHRYHILQFGKQLRAHQQDLITMSDGHIYFNFALTLLNNQFLHHRKIAQEHIPLLKFVTDSFIPLLLPIGAVETTKARITQLTPHLSRMIKESVIEGRSESETSHVIDLACECLFVVLPSVLVSAEAGIIATDLLEAYQKGKRELRPAGFELISNLWMQAIIHAILKKDATIANNLIPFYYDLLRLGENTPGFYDHEDVQSSHNEILKGFQKYFATLKEWKQIEKQSERIDINTMDCIAKITTERGDRVDPVVDMFFDSILTTNLLHLILLATSSCSLKYGDILKRKEPGYEKNCQDWVRKQDYLLAKLRLKFAENTSHFMSKVPEHAAVSVNYHPNLSDFIIQSCIYKTQLAKEDFHYCDYILTITMPQLALLPDDLSKIQVITNLLKGSIQLSLSSQKYTSKATKAATAASLDKIIDFLYCEFIRIFLILRKEDSSLLTTVANYNETEKTLVACARENFTAHVELLNLLKSEQLPYSVCLGALIENFQCLNLPVQDVLDAKSAVVFLEFVSTLTPQDIHTSLVDQLIEFVSKNNLVFENYENVRSLMQFYELPDPNSPVQTFRNVPRLQMILGLTPGSMIRDAQFGQLLFKSFLANQLHAATLPKSLENTIHGTALIEQKWVLPLLQQSLEECSHLVYLFSWLKLMSLTSDKTWRELRLHFASQNKSLQETLSKKFATLPVTSESYTDGQPAASLNTAMIDNIYSFTLLLLSSIQSAKNHSLLLILHPFFERVIQTGDLVPLVVDFYFQACQGDAQRGAFPRTAPHQEALYKCFEFFASQPHNSTVFQKEEGEALAVLATTWFIEVEKGNGERDTKFNFDERYTTLVQASVKRNQTTIDMWDTQINQYDEVLSMTSSNYDVGQKSRLRRFLKRAKEILASLRKQLGTSSSSSSSTTTQTTLTTGRPPLKSGKGSSVRSSYSSNSSSKK